MDIRKVKKLIELLEESGIAEIEIKEGEEAVRISRYPPGAPAQYAPAPAEYGLPAPILNYFETSLGCVPSSERRPPAPARFPAGLWCHTGQAPGYRVNSDSGH